MPQPARYPVVLYHVIYKILELPKNSEIDDFFLTKGMHDIDKVLDLTDEVLLAIGTYSDRDFGHRPPPPSIPIQQKEHIQQLCRWREHERNNGGDIREQDSIGSTTEDYQHFLQVHPPEEGDSLEALQAASATPWTYQRQPYGAMTSPSSYVWCGRMQKTPIHQDQATHVVTPVHQD